jgi:hypothetical protein
MEFRQTPLNTPYPSPPVSPYLLRMPLFGPSCRSLVWVWGKRAPFGSLIIVCLHF